MYELNIFSRGVNRAFGEYKNLKDTYEALRFLVKQGIRIDRYDITMDGSYIDSISKHTLESTGSSFLEYIDNIEQYRVWKEISVKAYRVNA